MQCIFVVFTCATVGYCRSIKQYLFISCSLAYCTFKKLKFSDTDYVYTASFPSFTTAKVKMISITKLDVLQSVREPDFSPFLGFFEIF